MTYTERTKGVMSAPKALDQLLFLSSLHTFG